MTATSLAPAVMARRYRWIKIVYVYLLVAGVVGVALAIDKFSSLFQNKMTQILYGILSGTLVISLAFWKIRVPCPRCGWNIYLRKDAISMLATYIPSSFPNCGLDLEHNHSNDNNLN